MGEMVADRCMQTLTYLQTKDEAIYSLVRKPVEDLVAALREIERSLNKSGTNKKVVDSMEIIRGGVNLVEDVLETWGVIVEETYMDKKIKKKRGFVKRWFAEEKDDGRVIKDYTMYMSKILNLVNSSVVNIFPEEALEGQPSQVTEERSWRWPGFMHSHGMKENFVERENDSKELISLVTSREDQHKVVSIWGVKGLGKTSLVWKIYISPQVRSCFDAFAWISVTQDYEMDNLLQNILNQLGAEEKKKGAPAMPRSILLKKEGPEEEKAEGADEENKQGAEYYGFIRNMRSFMSKLGTTPQKKSEVENKEIEEKQPKSSEENMVDELKKILSQKKCFIVVDGISQLLQWTNLSTAFPMENTNTKILLTTDKEEISRVGFGYQLKSLNEEQGWGLLQKYAFHGKKAPELGIVPTLGKEIVRQCEGLPSAISSIGRTLNKMRSDEWHKVINDVQGYLETENLSQSNEISNEVSVPSYDDLSYCLKQCFLYLAIFKDADPRDLSFLWLAEGMLSSPQQQQGTIMDAAEHYIRKLCRSGMLQMEKDALSANRRFKRLCLHNNAQELSLYMGEREEFKLEIVDFSDGRFDSFSLFGRSRRLAIHFNKRSSPQEHDLSAMDNLRSLFFLNSSQECVHLPVRIPDFKEFALLRVVHFVRCKFEGRKLPQGIDQLLNLTYLGVLYCDLDRLPPSISNFRRLHVLNLRACDDARITIPNVIAQMVRLKHLRLPTNLEHEQSESGKLKLDKLEDLETLDGFNADIHDVDSLSRLQKLRYLGIHAYSNNGLKSIIEFMKSHGARIFRINLLIKYKCDFTSAEGLTVLEELLMCPNLDALIFSMVLIHKFPKCGTLASKDLTQIKLMGTKLIADPMEALGMFPNLQKLCLGYGAFVGRKMKTGNAGFPELEYLEFRCLPNLEGWSMGKGAMKKLSTFTFRKCPKLQQIPQELISVSSHKYSRRELTPHATAEASETDLDAISTASETYLDAISAASETYLDAISAASETYLDAISAASETDLDDISTASERELDAISIASETEQDPISIASVTDYRLKSALQIFSCNHVLQALGCLCLSYLFGCLLSAR